MARAIRNDKCVISLGPAASDLAGAGGFPRRGGDKFREFSGRLGNSGERRAVPVITANLPPVRFDACPPGLVPSRPPGAKPNPLYFQFPPWRTINNPDSKIRILPTPGLLSQRLSPSFPTPTPTIPHHYPQLRRCPTQSPCPNPGVLTQVAKPTYFFTYSKSVSI